MGVGIDDPYDGAIGRCLVAFEWERRLLSATPEYKLALAGSDSVEGNRRFTFRFEIGIESLHDHEFSPVERSILDGRYHRANDACYLHLSVEVDLVYHSDNS